jgi:hypothetical protein
MLRAATLPELLDQVATRFPERAFHFPASEGSFEYQMLPASE